MPWAPTYPVDHPLRNVTGWFAPHLQRSRDVELRTASAESDLTLETEAGVDGVVISGSPRDAWAEDPINLSLCDLVKQCRRNGIPLLGVCYGHQVMARALGGVVARHPSGWELGSVPIRLTNEGRQSPIFYDLPGEFSALQSHADAVLQLPPDCGLLATGDHTQVQAFSCEESLFGVQFHPETNPDILRFLWGPRRDLWRENIGFDLDQRLDTVPAAPAAVKVLHNFIHHIVL